MKKNNLLIAFALTTILTSYWANYFFENKFKIIILETFLIISSIIFVLNKRIIKSLTRKKRVAVVIAINIIIIMYIQIQPFIGVLNCKINNGIFTKYCKGPVIESELGSIFDPQVIKEDGIYKMYASTRYNDSITLFVSNDGKNWDNVGISLEPTKGSWDNIVNRATVIKVDNRYYMYYTGQSDQGSKIGLAISEDGVKFYKINDNPILAPENEYEQYNVMNPYVFYDQSISKYRMYYASGEMYEPDVIAYAESEDGINWTKYENNPIIKKGFSNKYDSYKVGGCEVHKIDENKYIIVYIGYTDINTARVLYAESSDGINFKAPHNNLLLSPSSLYFDSDATYKPSLVFEEDNIYMWYNGRTKDKEKIGMAWCKECIK